MAVICIDFDGTVVKHEYPIVGPTLPGAVETLKELVSNGHRLILYTMRDKKELQDAVDWYEVNNIPLYGVQYNPTQTKWTTSNKCHADLFIDDCGLGIPLSVDVIKDSDEGLRQIGRPFVDWSKVREMLVNKGIIDEK